MDKNATQRELSQSEHSELLSESSVTEGVDLYTIYQAVKKYWKLIVSVTLFFTSCSLILSFFMQSIYRAEVVLLPPLYSNVEKLNIPDIYEIKIDELYGNLILNLKSSDIRIKFYNENSLFTELKGKDDDVEKSNDIFQDKFNDVLIVDEGDKKIEDIDVVKVFLEGTDAVKIASWLNDFVDLADVITIQLVVDTIRAKIDIQKSLLQTKIDSLRVVAEQSRLDTITKLEAAIVVAEKMGFHEYTNVPYYSVSQTMSGSNVIGNDGQKSPEYLKGTKALRAEVSALKSRKNNDPFIPGLNELKRELLFFENIDLEQKGLHAMRFDQKAIAENDPVKPNKILMVFLGFFMGLLVSIFSVIIINIVNPQKV